MNLFALKTLLKTCIKTLVNERNFALEILIEKQPRNGVFIPSFRICPLAAEKGQFALLVDRPVDRPTVKNLTVAPVGRPGLDPESNGSLAGRLPGRPN